jgi:hypothetical protein
METELFAPNMPNHLPVGQVSRNPDIQVIDFHNFEFIHDAAPNTSFAFYVVKLFYSPNLLAYVLADCTCTVAHQY